jgi:glycerol-3-phosphate O-acyltransferase
VQPADARGGHDAHTARAGRARADTAWRLTPDDVERTAAFEAGLPTLATRCGTNVDAVRRELRDYLGELRTAHVPSAYAWLVRAGRRLMASGYERIDYDDAQVEALRTLLGERPAVVLSSHRSYLDGGAFTVGFADRALPALTVFAGANLDFWPIGPFWRRANAVMLRRSAPSPAYGYAVRHVVATLLARRLPLQWFVEGTRSRTGLLGAPRLGLLAYVAEAYREGLVDDVALVPASVAYDQLREVDEYEAAARGAAKAPETLGWLVRFVRAQRGRHGAIHVRFGEPVSLRAVWGERSPLPPAGTPDWQRALEELARAVARRIDASTPLTGTALVCGALLAWPGRWIPQARLDDVLRAVTTHARCMGLPLATGANVDAPEQLQRVLASLREHGLVESTRDDTGAMRHWIAPGRELAAAYHRNTVLSHFLPGAALALARGATVAPTNDSVDTGRTTAALAELHALFAAFVDVGDGAAFVARAQSAAHAPLPATFVAAALGPMLEAMASVEVVCAARVATGRDDELLAEAFAHSTSRIAAGDYVHPEGVSLPLLASALRFRRTHGSGSPSADRWRRELAAFRERFSSGA